MGTVAIVDFPGLDGFNAIRADWAALADTLVDCRFHHCQVWYQSFLSHLIEDPSSLHFFLALDGKRAIAIFPMIYRPMTVAGLPVRAWTLPWHPHFQRADFVLGNTAVEARAWLALLGHLRGLNAFPWDVVHASGVLLTSSAFRCLTGTEGFPSALGQFGANDFLTCHGVPFASRVSKNLKGILRKAQHKLRGIRDVAFCSTRNQVELNAYFREFVEVEASGWKGMTGAGTAIKLNSRLMGFYQSLMQTSTLSHECEINLLRAEGRCIAAQFCVVHNGVTTVMKIGYDEQYSRVAPGHLLLRDLLVRCESDPNMHEVDLVSDANWHSSWRPDARRTADVLLFNANARGTSARLLHGMSSRLASLRARVMTNESPQREGPRMTRADD